MQVVHAVMSRGTTKGYFPLINEHPEGHSVLVLSYRNAKSLPGSHVHGCVDDLICSSTPYLSVTCLREVAKASCMHGLKKPSGTFADSVLPESLLVTHLLQKFGLQH